MFDNITFTKTRTTMPLTSRMVSEQTYKKPDYSGEENRENLSNSEFVLSGGVDAFRRPPITEFAPEHLFYLQAFNIFHYEKGSFTRRQNVHSYLILYTYDGEGKLEYEGKTYSLKQGDGVLIDCMRPHYYEAAQNWDVAVFHFNGPFAAHMYEEYIATGNLVFHEGTDERFHRNLEQVLSIYSSPSVQRDLRASHAIEGMVLYLLVKSSNFNISRGDVPEAIQKVIVYMENHYTEDISLDKMAEMISTSKYHFSKEFKRYTGFSPHDYLIRMRIDQAKILLKTTSMPANKVAHSVGIHDINNFNYLFKKKVGKTPIQYRKSPDVIL